MVRNVREGRYSVTGKNIRQTLDFIGELMFERMKVSNDPTDSYKMENLTFEGHMYKVLMSKHGIEQVALKYCEQWLISIKENAG